MGLEAGRTMYAVRRSAHADVVQTGAPRSWSRCRACAPPAAVTRLRALARFEWRSAVVFDELATQAPTEQMAAALRERAERARARAARAAVDAGRLARRLAARRVAARTVSPRRWGVTARGRLLE